MTNRARRGARKSREVLVERVVDAPPHVVRRMFERDWVAEVAPDIGPSKGPANARLHGVVAGAHASKRVVMHAGAATEMFDKIVVPVEWHAEPMRRLFPEMTALVELVPVAGSRTAIVFWGHYDPPLGRVGAFADRNVARGVARSTVDALVDAIAHDATATRPRVEPA